MAVDMTEVRRGILLGELSRDSDARQLYIFNRAFEVAKREPVDDLRPRMIAFAVAKLGVDEATAGEVVQSIALRAEQYLQISHYELQRALIENGDDPEIINWNPRKSPQPGEIK